MKNIQFYIKEQPKKENRQMYLAMCKHTNTLRAYYADNDEMVFNGNVFRFESKKCDFGISPADGVNEEVIDIFNIPLENVESGVLRPSKTWCFEILIKLASSESNKIFDFYSDYQQKESYFIKCEERNGDKKVFKVVDKNGDEFDCSTLFVINNDGNIDTSCFINSHLCNHFDFELKNGDETLRKLTKANAIEIYREYLDYINEDD